MKKKVLVGMSGGVDSSVTACILKEQGYEVIGIHLRFWTDPTLFNEEEAKKFPQNKCCTLEGLSKTRQIAHRLDIPFYVLNFEDPFKREVVDFFIDGYGKGITPNPCIECNRTIKFGLFLDKMRELGADYIATGHYARKVTVPAAERPNKGAVSPAKVGAKTEKYELWMAKDKTKDQSYFLYTLTQEKLKHVLFPIGEYTKAEVRTLAKKYGINEVNRQKESQNLCFFPESKHGPFLQRYLKKQAFTPGPIMTVSGLQLGLHKGLPHYTIGQRKGLGIGGIKGDTEGDPWYVVKIDQPNNTLVVGKENDLFTKKFNAHTLSFIDEKGFEALMAKSSQIKAKIRYRFPLQPVTVTAVQLREAMVEFSRPQRAITPGQSVVFYEDEKVVGGGMIT